MRFRNTGFNLLIKDLIMKECLALEPCKFLTENGFSVMYDINRSRVDNIFYDLEKDGFFKHNNIDITYYERKYRNRLHRYKVYVKRGDV